MPTPQQNARADAQEQRLNDLARRMDKYDQIIDNLQEIVTRLEAKHENNTVWIRSILTMLTIGATVVGAVIGAVATHLIK